MVMASLLKIVGYIGPGRDDQAELTQAELTLADLTQGRVDPHSSKELSHWDVSFQYPQHMFWLRIKKNSFQICTLIWRPGKRMSYIAMTFINRPS